MGIGAILKSAREPSMEEEMSDLVRERGAIRRSPPPPPRRVTDALTPEVRELMSEGMPIATKQLIKETSDAVDKLVTSAQTLKEQVTEWGKVLTEQSEEMRRLIATEHAKLMSAREHIHSAIAGKPYQATIAEKPYPEEEQERHREDE